MSISQRLWLAFAITCAAVVLMFGVQASSYLHTQTLAKAAAEIDAQVRDIRGAFLSLREAETQTRGYLLTGDARLRRWFEEDVEEFHRHLERFRGALDRADSLGPLAYPRAADRGALANIETLAGVTIALMRSTIQDWRPEAPDPARAAVAVRNIRNATDQIADRVEEIAGRGQATLDLAETRIAKAQEQTMLFLVGGGALLLIFLGILTGQVIVRTYRSFEPLIEGTRRIGAGDLAYRIPSTNRDEVDRLAASFNDMAEHLALATGERGAAEQAHLAARRELEAQGAMIETLSRMAHRMQTCLSFQEFGEVVSRYVPQVLPGRPGGLYLLNNSRNMMRLDATWGSAEATSAFAAEFGPRDCWAMRRGQAHRVGPSGREVPCLHAGDRASYGYHCLPLIAHGDVIGILYVEDSSDLGASGDIPERQLEVLVENMALALANFRLRETLREQSIRDRLTGLFNRRYLDETLALELARVKRADQTTSAIMLDIDHFKAFNDRHGHDAGDAVLRAVAGALKSVTRGGDIVCRYGGEEFCVLMPGAPLEQARARADAIRQAVERIKIEHNGVTLGPVTVSAGIAAWPSHGETMEAVLQRADAALYEAKREGRNRALVAAAPETPAAA
jgi:diguanylate cyclase (GGDEF)-like protein